MYSLSNLPHICKLILFIFYTNISHHMQILPHVMFFAVAIFFAVVGRKFLKPLTSPTMLPVFTILLPLSKTITVIYKKRISQVKICWNYRVKLSCYSSQSPFLSFFLSLFSPSFSYFLLYLSVQEYLNCMDYFRGLSCIFVDI